MAVSNKTQHLKKLIEKCFNGIFLSCTNNCFIHFVYDIKQNKIREIKTILDNSRNIPLDIIKIINNYETDTSTI